LEADDKVRDLLCDFDFIVSEFHSGRKSLKELYVYLYMVYEGVSSTFNDGIYLLPGKTSTPEVKVTTLYSVNIEKIVNLLLHVTLEHSQNSKLLVLNLKTSQANRNK
jgi:hypothetical protein